MSLSITTHILDLSTGVPAAGVAVQLAHREPESGEWQLIAERATDSDGRIKDFLGQGSFSSELTRCWKLIFAVQDYFENDGKKSFFPQVIIEFTTGLDQSGRTHYHVPLLISPFGYQTYRGS